MNYTNFIPQIVSDEETERLWSCAVDRESFLQALRAQGATKIESIRALRRSAKISLAEAKEAAHFSQTWADVRESDDRFHEVAIDALAEHAAEQNVA